MIGRPAIVITALIAAALTAVVFLAAPERTRDAGPAGFQVRTEIMGEVAAGRIYTTAINQRQLDERLPVSRPYLLELSSEGEVLLAQEMEFSPIAYRMDENGLRSYTVLDRGNPRYSGTTVLIDDDETYELRVQDNDHTDFHGILRSGDSSFYLPSYKLHDMPDGRKIESFFIEEQDLRGAVGFTWESLDHVPVEEAEFRERRRHWKRNRIHDCFHGNSMAFTNDGNLLISGRHVNQVLKIDRSTGEVIWRLGGKSSDFEFVDDPMHGFSHQHSASQLPNGNILLYDNGNLHDPPETRVVEYELDRRNMTARLVWSYTGHRFTYATGSVQRLPGGHTLIGWGLELRMSSKTPRITELDADGKVVMQIYFPDDAGFYGAYKM